MKTLVPTQVERKPSTNRDFLYIRLTPADANTVVPAEVLAQLGPNEHAIEALVGLRDDLTVEFQSQLIAGARDILNQMEASLRGGIGARVGDKAVKA